jgi:3-phytase
LNGVERRHNMSMRRFGWWLVGLSLVGCAGTGTSPLDNQPGTRFNSAGANNANGRGTATSVNELKPIFMTDPVEHAVGGVAVWANRIAPEKSLIFGLDSQAKVGGLICFGLDGKKTDRFDELNLPTGIDVEYDVQLGDKKVDLTAVSEAAGGNLRILAIDQSSGKLLDVSGATSILGEGKGAEKEPVGVGLFKRADGVLFAIVAPKAGPKAGFLAQYRLDVRDGKVDLKLVRRFGESAGASASLVVDDELGYVYCGDAKTGMKKYLADPDAKGAAVAVATFGKDGYQGDRAGMTVYPTDEKNGYLLSLDKTEKQSRLFVYSRTGINETDLSNKVIQGFAVPVLNSANVFATGRDLGKEFPQGLIVMSDGTMNRYFVFDWRTVSQQITRK